MAKILLLNSGGLDSALLAAVLKTKQAHEVHSLHIDTHQVNRAQAMAAAQTTADKFCSSHKVIELDLGQTSNYWEEFYVDPPAPVTMYDVAPNEEWKQSIFPTPQTGERLFTHFHICPNWTMVVTSIAIAYAKTIGIEQVYTGHRLSLDEQYLLSYNDMANQKIHRATRAMLNAPFHANISYAEAAIILVGAPLTVAKKTALRTEFAYTYSCRWPTPCGVCEKCRSRADLGLV